MMVRVTRLEIATVGRSTGLSSNHDGWRQPPSVLTSLCLGVLGGVLLAAAFPPWGVAPLAFVGPALLVVAIDGATRGRRLLVGLLFGLAFFGPVLWWVESVGTDAWVVLVVGEAAFMAVLALLAEPLLTHPRPIVAALGWTGLWVLIEAARARVPFGGFPWGPIGAPLVGTALDGLSPLLGGIAVGGMVAFAAAALGLAVRRGLRVVALALAIVVATLLAAIPFQPASPSGRALRVALVQGNVPLPAAADSPARSARVLADHVALTRTIPPGRFDLVVWPEGVIDLAGPRPGVGDPAPEPARTLARSLGTEIIVGVVSGAGPGRFWNSALAVSPSGTVIGVYDKMRPVPYGEYVPFRRYLGFVTALRDIPLDMARGARPALLPVPGGSVGTPISFETAFARIVRRFADEGAGAIVVPTNTSSFGERSGAAEQELQLSRVRSTELGLWTLQSSPAGISAIIDPAGTVTSEAGLYRSAIVSGRIRLGRSTTLFARWGETPAIVLAAILVLVAAWSSARRRRRSGPRADEVPPTPVDPT